MSEAANPKAGTAQAAAPAKRRKPQGPRKERPTFLLIRATDEQGQPIALDADRLEIQSTKDAGKLLQMVTKGGLNGAVIKEVVLSEARENPAAAPAQPAA